MVCSSFLLLHGSFLIDCMLIGIYPFLLGCVICWHIIAQSNFFMMQEDQDVSLNAMRMHGLTGDVIASASGP